MMANPNMYVTVKRINPERLECPVKDCTAEGKEENRVETPFIAGLGKLTVYLCDTHATALAVTFLDEHALSEEIEWDEPTKDDKQPALPGEAGALFAFMGWLTSRKEVSGPFSCTHDAGPAAQLVGKFIKMQGWRDVHENWHHCIKPFEEEAEALGRAHLENAARARVGAVSELEDISYGHAPMEEA